MGRGAKTSEVDVNKTIKEYSSIPSSQMKNIKSDCLFAVVAKVQVDNKLLNPKLEDKVFLILEKNNILIFINNQLVGNYTGNLSQKIIKCLKNGYVYVGSITSITRGKLIVVEFVVSGQEK